MTLFAIWLDNGGAHDPQRLMSLWTTQALAETEIARLQRDVFVYGNRPQRFWLSEVPIDVVREGDLEDFKQTPYPPYK